MKILKYCRKCEYCLENKKLWDKAAVCKIRYDNPRPNQSAFIKFADGLFNTAFKIPSKCPFILEHKITENDKTKPVEEQRPNGTRTIRL